MKYFAYGMNTELKGMAIRCPQAKPLGKAILPDYCLAMRGVADIIKAPYQQVEGALWEITPECEAALDRLEGYPLFYTKIHVAVEFNGEWVETMVYQMVNVRQDDFSIAGHGYFHTLKTGYQQFGIPESQLKLANEQARLWSAKNKNSIFGRYQYERG